MKITTTLSSQDLTKAIREIEKFKRKINIRLDSLCKALAEMGVDHIRGYYSEAIANDYNGVTINIEDRSRSDTIAYVIVASGQPVCFIEFGTGVEANTTKGAEYGFVPGSWSGSELGKGLFIKNGYWYYNKQKLTGTTPTEGMSKTAFDLRTALLNKAREIFAR